MRGYLLCFAFAASPVSAVNSSGPSLGGRVLLASADRPYSILRSAPRWDRQDILPGFATPVEGKLRGKTFFPGDRGVAGLVGKFVGQDAAMNSSPEYRGGLVRNG
jgi:hypothetical protein